MAYYAWSEFPGKAVPGDTVTADKLGVSKEEFDAFVESGAVREDKFPENLGGLSPAEKAKRDLAIAAGQIEADDVQGAGVVEKEKAKE